MSIEHPLIARVEKAKTDSHAADDLIRDYMPFITDQAMKHLRRPVVKDNDDELSIAMFGFFEAIRSYSPLRGSFLAYAAMLIRSRLIDYARSEKRHSGLISANDTVFEDDDTELIERFTDDTGSVDLHMKRQMTRDEIEEFSGALEGVGLTLSDIADACPKQERTLAACHIALNWAKAHPALLEEAVKTGKLPLGAICDGTGLERKTLERHRKYLMGLFVAYTNGFEIIRGHLRSLSAGIVGNEGNGGDA